MSGFQEPDDDFVIRPPSYKWVLVTLAGGLVLLMLILARACCMEGY